MCVEKPGIWVIQDQSFQFIVLKCSAFFKPLHPQTDIFYIHDTITTTCLFFYSYPFVPVVHRARGCSQENLMLVWQYHQLLSRFLVNGHFPLMSCQLVNDKGDMKWNQELFTDLLLFTLQLEQFTVDALKNFS